MTLTPLLNADPIVQLHVVTALLAMVLGPFIFFRRKGNRTHKTLGYIWVSTMIIAIGSSYFIHQIRLWGPFSPIHLLTVYSTWALAQSVYFARQGNIRAHRAAMKGLYTGSLLIAGTLTLLPGRTLNKVLFGANGESGFYLALGAIAIILGLLLTNRRLGIFSVRGLRRRSPEEVQ